MPFWLILIAQLAVIAYALLAGVFLAFSDFIMRSLSRAPAAAGADVMQIINREVFRYVFIPTFMVMVPISMVLAIFALADLTAPGALFLFGAGAVYVVGAFFVTIARNVPMNTRLDRFDTETADAQAYWRTRYLPVWTRWNTVRTAACLIAALLALIGVIEISAAAAPVVD